MKKDEIDKNSTNYFMTKMTQEEWDKRRGDKEIKFITFNKITKHRPIPLTVKKEKENVDS